MNKVIFSSSVFSTDHLIMSENKTSVVVKCGNTTNKGTACKNDRYLSHDKCWLHLRHANPDSHCRFIRGPFSFCNLNKVQGSPYCHVHKYRQENKKRCVYISKTSGSCEKFTYRDDNLCHDHRRLKPKKKLEELKEDSAECNTTSEDKEVKIENDPCPKCKGFGLFVSRNNHEAETKAALHFSNVTSVGTVGVLRSKFRGGD